MLAGWFGVWVGGWGGRWVGGVFAKGEKPYTTSKVAETDGFKAHCGQHHLYMMKSRGPVGASSETAFAITKIQTC